MRGLVMRNAAVLLGGVILVAGLGGCAGGEADAPADPTGAEASVAAGEPAAKEWVVDTSGWWVPEDPSGCLDQTVDCLMAAQKARVFKKGNTVFNVMTHGDTITLECKAPTPAPIRNSVETYSKYWYHAQVGDQMFWVPDVYVVKDDAAVAAMAEGVPDCTSSTPGING
jgi:hypothetical protein